MSGPGISCAGQHGVGLAELFNAPTQTYILYYGLISNDTKFNNCIHTSLNIYFYLKFRFVSTRDSEIKPVNVTFKQNE